MFDTLLDVEEMTTFTPQCRADKHKRWGHSKNIRLEQPWEADDGSFTWRQLACSYAAVTNAWFLARKDEYIGIS